MGSFEDHVRYGVVFYAGTVLLVSAPVAYLLGGGLLDSSSVILAASASVFGFPFALAGASFPDVDHHSAKPHRMLKRWVAFAAAVVSGYALLESGVAARAGATVAGSVGIGATAPQKAVIGVAVAASGAVAAAGVTFVGVDVLKPRHRGVTHTLRAGFVVAIIVGVGSGYAASVVVNSAAGALFGGVAAASFFVGFLSHLQCDGMLVSFLPDAM